MRALAILLLSCSFVVAGDASPLEHAVQEFKSRSPEKRNAAQRVVDRELRRMLAPLLEAMKDADPEVRLRARKSLLALIPNPPVQEEPRPAVGDMNNLFAQANAQRQHGWALLRLGVQKAPKQAPLFAAAQQLRLQKDAGKKAARQFLASFGLAGAPTFGLPTNPSGAAGFVVHRAKKTAAAFGLKRGDLIVKVNGLKIVNADNLRVAFGDRPERAKIEIVRAGKPVTLTMQPAAPR